MFVRIERVDDKTVKCFLSNEELEEYDIDYKDFVLRSDKARQIVQEIIEQAAEQVGYKPPRFAFDMQIMMLPDQGLLLTFSESDSAGMANAQQILDCLKEMKQALMKTREQLGVDVRTGSSVAEEAVKPQKAIFVFDRLQRVMDFAQVLPANLRVYSELYKMDDAFYLFIQKGSASYERYSRACIQAMEFGRLYGADERQFLQIKEHGSCLIAEKALKKLRN